MIENLLIDPQVIWEALNLVRHKIDLKSENDIAPAIDEILQEMEQEEIDRRIKASIKPTTFRLHDPIETAEDQISKFSGELRDKFSKSNMQILAAAAKNKVNAIKTNNKRREFYHGKKVLAEFYKRHLHSTGMSKEIFIYGCAQAANKRKSVDEFFSGLLRKIDPTVNN
jgi:hypothetical protein